MTNGGGRKSTAGRGKAAGLKGWSAGRRTSCERWRWEDTAALPALHRRSKANHVAVEVDEGTFPPTPCGVLGAVNLGARGAPFAGEVVGGGDEEVRRSGAVAGLGHHA